MAKALLRPVNKIAGGKPHFADYLNLAPSPMGNWLRLLIPLAVCLALVRLYSWYKDESAPIPPGVLIGREDYSSAKSASDVAAQIKDRVGEQVLVLFNGERLILQADEIGLEIDAHRSILEASQFLEGDAFVRSVLRQILGLPMEVQHVPLYYTLDHERARQWLQEIDEGYGSQSRPFRLLPVTREWLAEQGTDDTSSLSADLAFMPYAYPDWTWKEGDRGVRVDIESSLAMLPGPFIASGERVWTLATFQEPPLAPTLSTLAEAVDEFTSAFHGFASYWVKDLTTGEVVEVDSEVAFSGMSTLKLLVVMAIMHNIDGVSSATDLGQWIDLALVDSNNAAANLLMQYLGDGSVDAGAGVVTAFARSLGFENSFYLTGYDDDRRVEPLQTPANLSNWDTKPDTHLQTTAAEMGRMLAGIYECIQGKGVFIETYPGTISPAECQEALFYVSGNIFLEMLWGGLPDKQTQTVWHKHGFTEEQHGNVALIWGPAGPYVISLFLYKPNWLDWSISNSTMYNVSRITWKFQEQVAAMSDRSYQMPLELPTPDGFIQQPNR